jgi:hypothetical protein
MEIVGSKSKSIKSLRVRECMECMVADIGHGKEWEASWLEDRLGMHRDSAAFGLAVSEINAHIESEYGYHLTARGKHGNSYFVEPVNRTVGIVKSMNRKALGMLLRSAKFASRVVAHHGDKLSESERRQIEKRAQVQAMRFALASRLR